MYDNSRWVLILVLVDHTLGAIECRLCEDDTLCLNPCFSGPYSRSANNVASNNVTTVLILVLVDHTLGAVKAYVADEETGVLILVLVDHTLGDCSYSSLWHN